MAYKTILYIEKDGVAEIILNRPEKRNSLNDVMIDEITQVFKGFTASKDISAVILSGAGGNLCSGMDLDYLQKISQFDLEQNKADSQKFKNMLLAIYECSKPVIAKVSGYALAGGCGIASCCDIIVADDTVEFGYPEVKIGFIPAIVMPFLLKRVTETHAKELMLTAMTIGADEAERMGLVNMAVKPGELDSKTLELCELFRNNSMNSVTITKEMFRKLSGMNFDEALDYASELNASVRMTEDFKKVIKNFLDKRKKK